MDPLTITSNVVSTFIGKQLFSKAITDTSNSIYISITDIFNYNDNIDDVLNYLDIRERVKTVDLLIKDIQNYNQTITNCVSNLHDIILLIREDLKQINQIIELHKQKYFPNWRCLDCKFQLYNLKLHSKILDNRLEYLIKSLHIMNFNNQHIHKTTKVE